MNFHIEHLAAQKDFSALSPTERAQVLAEMSQEEYVQLWRMLLAARQMDAAAMPPARLRATLLAHMAPRARPRGIRRLLAARMPVWQAAAALMLGVAAMALLKREVVVEKNVTAWQWRVDTVFQEKTLWRDRVVVKTKVVFREKAAAPGIVLTPEKVDRQSFDPVFQADEMSGAHIGTSLGDAPELIGFFTQGDQ